ncbi:MAG: BamA/TamA family outer membrane protein [Cytophagales bacterium]|nr:BamA/TamA family outer membrane protein [Armatimonadota bacterium]
MSFRQNATRFLLTGSAVLRSSAAPLWAAGAAAVLVTVTASAAQAQEGQIIAEVSVVGTKNSNPEAVRAAVATAGLKEGAPFRAAAFTAAKQAVENVGLYASVYTRTETTADRRLRVIVEVFENPVISQIVFTGNNSIPTKELVEKGRLVTRAGYVLNRNDLERDAQRIQTLYSSRGYRAFVSEIVEVDPKTNILTVPIVETVVEAISVEGLQKTKSIVVTREMRTKVGKPLNDFTLRRDVTRVFATGLFADISNVRTEEGSEEGRARLIIPVQEQRTGQVGVSFGYSQQQRLTGTLELSETNFRGRGQGVSASWTVGGAAARNSFELGFQEPWIDKNNTSLGVNIYDRFNYRFNRVLANNATVGQNSNQYYEERRGGSLTVSRPTSEVSRTYGTLRTESIRANNLDYNYNQLTEDQINSIRGSIVQDGDVSSISLRYSSNTKDNEQDPAGGTFFSPQFEFGNSRFNYQSPRFNSEFDPNNPDDPDNPRVFVDRQSLSGAFTKANLTLNRYFSLNGPRTLANIRENKKVIATRLLLGRAGGQIGFSEQYFLGGVDNLRGYPNDRFWGNNLFLFTAEYRLPVEKNGALGLVLFVDIGDAWGGTDVNRQNIPSFQQHANFRPNIGFGPGVRIKTPVGVVRLDYGFGQSAQLHFALGPSF